MASRKDNLKSLFSNSRTRIIILFTAALILTAVIVGVVKLRSSATPGPAASADVTNAPGGIRSIPGALDPTVQYAQLQEKQNLTQAEQAVKTGSSAIPTIIRTQTIGQGVQVVGPQPGKTGVGFQALVREGQGGAQKSLWIQNLKDSNCSKETMDKVVSQGAELADLKQACSCIQLKDNGYKLAELDKVCSCKELKASGFNARQLKEAGFTAGRLRACGFDACELKNAGFTAQEMKDGGFTDGELKGAGYSENEIKKASGLPDGITAEDVRKAGCGVVALKRLREAGVSAAAIRRISGCSAAQLRAAGYSAKDLADAGFTAAELKKAGYPEAEIKAAGLTPVVIPATAKYKDCSVETLRKARADGVSARTIRDTLGCSAAALKAAGYTAKELKDAGFTAAELKNAGFTAKELKDAGFSPKELRDAGFTAQQLKDAGFSARQLKDAGFSPKELKDAGFSAKQLKDAGLSASDLKAAGFTAEQLKNAGFDAKDLKDAGFTRSQLKAAGFNDDELTNAGFKPPETTVAQLPGQKQQGLPSDITGTPSPRATQVDKDQQQLQEILQRQNEQMADQRYQQNIKQRSADMLSAANQSLQAWKKVSDQVYIGGKPPKEKKAQGGYAGQASGAAGQQAAQQPGSQETKKAIIKAGDVVFAVLDTSVNSDEPGPILATIVSGQLKGSKLIGTFNLPSNSDKMVISFNTLSVPGAARTTSISAYAIDPNTARTALSSRTDHHYLLRYGSLFASTFLEGFGNAFQSANTTVTIGGTGGGDNIQVQNGIGRSALENAVIGLATVGKSWAQQAQQLFNTPTTVDVFSGTGMGILFTQDLTSL